MRSHRYDEREEQKYESKPNLNLRKGWIICFELKEETNIH